MTVDVRTVGMGLTVPPDVAPPPQQAVLLFRTVLDTRNRRFLTGHRPAGQQHGKLHIGDGVQVALVFIAHRHTAEVDNRCHIGGVVLAPFRVLSASRIPSPTIK